MASRGKVGYGWAMDSTEQLATISPPKSHYFFAKVSMALAAICVGQAAGTYGGEVSAALTATVILLGIWLVIAQYRATFRASSRGALTSLVLLPIMVLYGAIAFAGHLLSPNHLTTPVIAGMVVTGLVLLGFIILSARSNLNWSNAIEQAKKSEDAILPGQNSSFTSIEISSVTGAVSVMLVSFLLFAQTVPANPVFYMKNVNPSRARFNAPRTATYLIVQGLPDETILAEWTDAQNRLEGWLAEQAKRPGVTNFQQQDIVEPIKYKYPNSFLTWGSAATEEKGQRATWQEGDRHYEVLWDPQYQEDFGAVPVNYIERNLNAIANEQE